jgi:phosphate transport system permease protein
MKETTETMMTFEEKPFSLKQWVKSGEPMIWVNAAAVTISALAVIGLLLLLLVRGFGHFWPSNVLQADYTLLGEGTTRIIGERIESEQVPLQQLRDAGIQLETEQALVTRSLIRRGNRDVTGMDFVWLVDDLMSNISYPADVMAIERREWGHFYGFLRGIKQQGQLLVVDGGEQALWQEFQARIARASALHKQIKTLEKSDIGAINYQLEQLRLQERSLALNSRVASAKRANELQRISLERAELDAQYAVLQQKLEGLYRELGRDSFSAETMSGKQVELPLSVVVHAYQPNRMSPLDKVVAYLQKFWEFLTDEPREANTEGGIFPAIFGTVMMVLIMSIIVTPFGVIAAVYLREYAKQGPMTRVVRIAVNNLAIVYGVFGLGFFIYFLGAEIDQLFFKAALPAPTFGTPGLLWASLTLALLTLPVVIVSTEEGLSRIPKALREGSLALGATKAETLWRVVLPMSSPAMMTGLILAVARAAGEVAPLMLVGVVKLAPSLPVDANYPFLHLDQKFMHLGFHIYDVGFQSPNVEAARPLVYATALLLVIIIALLNFSAVALRNHLREKYKALDM